MNMPLFPILPSSPIVQLLKEPVPGGSHWLELRGEQLSGPGLEARGG